MPTRRYRIVNNVAGWIVFAIALTTYWLTLEPTASYWDCGEFIIQGDKLEVGHPPGNPIFMLTARFFVNFAKDTQSIPLMVNAMSGLLSALTILLLFWTITYLVRRLIVRDNDAGEISLQKYLVIIGSGVVGALVYCWSDTFWFSAVEGEVYAFSSFCTALVFWLILKWEARADQPYSDRWLILIAYIIGVSVAVHLLNLLCIPAVVLVFVYRRYNNVGLKQSLIALLVSFVIIFFVLYGLVPGFIKAAQVCELFCVNTLGMSFNSGALLYALLIVAAFIWTICELNSRRSDAIKRIAVMLLVTLSGGLFIGSGISIGILLEIAFAALLWIAWRKKLPLRSLNVAMWSIGVIFCGYSSYALILIRSTADTPMNQNSPDNVFALEYYLSREQYGENPLLYGETLNSAPQKKQTGIYRDTIQYDDKGHPIILTTPSYQSVIKPGKRQYAKGVPGADPVSEYGFLTQQEIEKNKNLAARGKDYYVLTDRKPEATYNPELNMLLPRIYSRMHSDYYRQWVDFDTVPENMVEIYAIDETSGEKVAELDTQSQPTYNQMTGTISYPQKIAYKPTWQQNLAYFFNYQLSHMYMRYFMWNFAGRQNDINNQFGELDAGNWISGIPFIDNARLGDQSLLPEDLGSGNKGHNVFYMLPLILGLIGLGWQAFAGKRGIEQFWVIFFFFFMTGIAIVLYLNQPPNQPRERDYAFAGSFYAFSIWIGFGVCAMWRIFMAMIARRKDAQPKASEEDIQPETAVNEPHELGKKSVIAAAVACVLGLIVPLQMVSQTWDDHDRSGRYAALDYAISYLESLEPNAIVFCNGDNDTFPLWYAQEVEGIRRDVRVINLSYLNSDWYATQQLQQAYEAAPATMTGIPADFAYGKVDVSIALPNQEPANMLDAIRGVYAGNGREHYGYPTLPSQLYIPVDKQKVIERGLVATTDTAQILDAITIDLSKVPSYTKKGYLSMGELLMYDIVATNAALGWPRPIYWVATVGEENHSGLTPYLRSTGMAHQIVPTMQNELAPRTDRAYNVVTQKYRWGGADKATAAKAPYFDETARRMLTTMRTTMAEIAAQLVYDGDDLSEAGKAKEAQKAYQRAREVATLMEQKLPQAQDPFGISLGTTVAKIYGELAEPERLADDKLKKKAQQLLLGLMKRYAPYVAYHNAMATEFYSPVFTTETQYAPYQFYRLIELYEQYGGAKAEADKIVAATGLQRDQLKKNWDMLNNRGSYDGQTMTVEDYLSQLSSYAATVNRLAAMSTEAYSAASAQDREIDSIYYEFVNYFLSNGGTQQELNADENCKKVDMTRSKRIYDAYLASAK